MHRLSKGESRVVLGRQSPGLEALQERQVVGVDVPGAGPFGAVGGQADALDPAGALQAGQGGGQAGVAAGGEVPVDVAGRGHPEGAEAALGGQPDDLALGRAAGRGPRGEPALGQVPDPLLALAAGDHDAALGPEDVEHAVDVAARRPAARLPGGAGPVLEGAGREGPAGAELAQDRAAQRLVGGQPGPQPPVVGGAVRGVAAHQQRVDRVVAGADDRGRVRPVLEQAPLAPEQRLQVGGVVGAEAAPQDQLVAAGDHADRVELEARPGRWPRP